MKPVLPLMVLNKNLNIVATREVIPTPHVCIRGRVFRKWRKQMELSKLQKPHSIMGICCNDCSCDHCSQPDVNCDIEKLHLQSSLQDAFGLFREVFTSTLLEIGDPALQHTLKEMLSTLVWVFGRLQKVSDSSDIIAILDYITRIHCGKQIGEFLIHLCFSYGGGGQAQSFDWSVLKHMVVSYETLKNHPVIVKFLKMVSLAFSCGVLSYLGLENNMKDLWDLITTACQSISSHTDFFAALIDLISFIGDRIASFGATGSWHSFLHTPTSYSKWVDDCQELLDTSAALCNPEAVGIDFHSYLNKLNLLLDEGLEIKKYLKAADRREMIGSLLSRLKILQTDIVIKGACGKVRISPFTMLIAAGSSVGKTTFTDTLFAHYAKVYKKELEGGVYTRTAAEAHWNNFKSSMWGCLLDDVASINPNGSSTDPSMADILQAANNVHFSTPQASLEDKGRTPFLCELMLATTNTENLKAHVWFNNPQAVRRRFPYIVNIVPKEQFRKPGTRMLDSLNIPKLERGHYPDLWDIEVKAVTINPDEQIVTTTILETSCIYEFIKCYNTWLKEHREAQLAFITSKNSVADVCLCEGCLLPPAACDCLYFGDFRIDSVPDFEDCELQGSVGSTISGVGVTAATFGSLKFTSECIGEAMRENGSLIESPLELLATSTAIGIQRATKFRNYVAGLSFDQIKKQLLKMLSIKLKEHSSKLLSLISILATISSLGLAWKFYKKNFSDLASLDMQVDEAFDIDNEGVEPEKLGETENVWRKDDYVPSEFLSRLATSWSGLPLSKVSSIVGRNVVWCRTTHGEDRHTVFRAFCLVGHLYVVPHHVLPCDDEFSIQVIHENNSEGCNGNVRFLMTQATIFRLPKQELAFFEINYMPVRRDLRGILPKHGAKIDGPGRLVSRLPNGSLSYNDTIRTQVAYERDAPQVNQKLDVAVSHMSRDTGNGECGSPMVVKLPSFGVIAGIHCFGGQDNTAVGVMIFQEDVELALKHFSVPPIDCAMPNLESQAFSSIISPKCAARFIEEGELMVYGSFEGFKRQPKSTATDTPFTNYLLNHGHTRKYGAAPMKGYRAVHIALKAMVQKQNLFREDIMNYCCDNYLDYIFSQLNQDDLVAVRNPVTLKVALNGMPGVKFIDSMNFKSSAGFPRNKSKSYYVTRLAADDTWQHPVTISDEIKSEVNQIWFDMTNGVRAAPVFMQHLKDEALPVAKVKSGKARVFMGGPFAWSICVRMLFLPFIRLMQRHKFVFEGAPGTNATSIEWTRLHQYLVRFGDHRMIAGDFKSFDKSMGSMVILKAFGIILEISARAGMTTKYLVAMQSVAEDTAFAFANFNGDFMQFCGSNPSGHPLTVIINCLVNSLYMRYCYFVNNPNKELKSFKDNVVLMTYGDDNVMGSNADWFNHCSIAATLQSVGIGYTMADKVSESVPFVHLSQVSFLKRNFVYNEEVDAVFAPLEEDSIWKSLMIWIPSKDECPQRQAVDIVRSAVQEWFFYGRERYEREVLFLRKMVHDVGLWPYVDYGIFPTWDCLKNRFNTNSVTALAEETTTTLRILGGCPWLPKESYKLPIQIQHELEMQSSIEAKMYLSKIVTARDFVFPRGMVIERVDSGYCSPGRSPKSLFREDLGRRSMLAEYVSLYRCRVEREKAPAQFSHDMSFVDLYENPQLNPFDHLLLQADELQDGHVNVQNQENLTFADAGLRTVHRTPMVSYVPDRDSSAGLGDFLSRPVAINSYSWQEGDDSLMKTQFAPWQLFFNTPAIKSKLNNYARLRAKLHLKFVVNASPFYYGALRVCYCPLDGTFRDTVEGSGDQIKFSQMPGDFLYPADMTSFEMELPFLWPGSWLNITNNDDFTIMGRVTYLQYSKLRSANGVSGQNVTVTCYAWASDVELAGLTTSLSLQADEYEQSGVISGPATAVANVASKLNDVPVIGPFARATEMGARAIGGIAALFGYSNPPVIDDVCAYVPKSFHSFANVETSVPLDKLTLDPKNEITIDKTVAGAGPDDELVITHLCGRRSYIIGALWTEAYIPGTQIMVFPVTPRMYAASSEAQQTVLNETPACHIAAMFSQWRGSMIYTLKFVKSRYHTGRVQISWDPQTIPTDGAETTSMTRIVDLQLETEVDFIVPYKASAPWLSTNNSANSWSITTSGTVAEESLIYNGYIRVTVLNELTGPSNLQEVDVLLFARTGDDFQLGVPNELPQWSFLPAQSLEENTSELSAVGGVTLDYNTNAATVGETVASVRTLLHRSSLYHRGLFGDPYSDQDSFELRGLCNLVNYIPRFPVEFGFNEEGVNYARSFSNDSKRRFQFSPQHPINWVTNCFAGYRGSFVHQFNYVANGFPLVDEFKVERDPRSHVLSPFPRQAVNRFTVRSDTSAQSTISRVPTTTQLNVSRDVIGQRGMSLTNANTQSALSVVSPQYSKWKFRPAFVGRRDILNGVSEQESLKVCATTRCGMSSTTQDDGWPILSVYVAGGVDFDPIYFICVPTLYSFASASPDNSF
jgi:hypothetical protein